jgi:hypothetical protein
MDIHRLAKAISETESRPPVMTPSRQTPFRLDPGLRRYRRTSPEPQFPSGIHAHSPALDGADGANARAFRCTNSRTLIGSTPVSPSTSLLNRSYRFS